MFPMKQSASDKFCMLCQETMQPNFLASCQGQADYFPEKYVNEEKKGNQSYKQMCPYWAVPSEGLATGLKRHPHALSGILVQQRAHWPASWRGYCNLCFHTGMKADRCLAGLQGVASGRCAEGIPGEHPPHLQPLPLGALLLPWHLSLWTIANLSPFPLLPPSWFWDTHLQMGQVSCQPSLHTEAFKLFFRQSPQTLGDEEGESRGWDEWSFSAGWGDAVWGLGRAPRDAPRLCQHLAHFPTLLREEKRLKKRLLENKTDEEISSLLSASLQGETECWAKKASSVGRAARVQPLGRERSWACASQHALPRCAASGPSGWGWFTASVQAICRLAESLCDKHPSHAGLMARAPQRWFICKAVALCPAFLDIQHRHNASWAAGKISKILSPICATFPGRKIAICTGRHCSTAVTVRLKVYCWDMLPQLLLA